MTVVNFYGIEQEELDGLKLSRLSALTTASFSSCQLSHLPEQLLQGCRKLDTVYLSNNRLTELPDRLFEGCVDLKTIYLTNNRLTQIENVSFRNCTKLTKVCLCFNNIDIQVDTTSLFSDCPEICEINFYGNPSGQASILRNSRDLAYTLHALDLHRLAQDRLGYSHTAFDNNIASNININNNRRRITFISDLKKNNVNINRQLDVEYLTIPEPGILCAISLEKNVVNVAKLIKCGHQFDADMFKQWLLSDNSTLSCPMCRTPVGDHGHNSDSPVEIGRQRRV